MHFNCRDFKSHIRYDDRDLYGPSRRDKGAVRITSDTVYTILRWSVTPERRRTLGDRVHESGAGRNLWSDELVLNLNDGSRSVRVSGSGRWMTDPRTSLTDPVGVGVSIVNGLRYRIGRLILRRAGSTVKRGPYRRLVRTHTVLKNGTGNDSRVVRRVCSGWRGPILPSYYGDCILNPLHVSPSLLLGTTPSFPDSLVTVRHVRPPPQILVHHVSRSLHLFFRHLSEEPSGVHSRVLRGRHLPTPSQFTTLQDP